MKEFDYSDENIVKTINNNYFRRNKLLKKIIEKLSDDNNDIKSICINAPWGTGKTVFVHELKYLINNSQNLPRLNKEIDLTEIKIAKDIGCYYFNSWENDSINSPTLALLYNILQDETWASAEFKNEIDNLKMNAANLLVRILSKGSLGFNDLKIIEPSVFDEIFSSNKIKEEFNKTINEYLQINKLKKLVIILDELDRCRPDYAVNMLESIKHFFYNEKLIFIISTDLIQLSYTIKKFYGDNFNSDLYLQRFFDRIITLDNSNSIEYIYNELHLELDCPLSWADMVYYYIKRLNMSVREINNFVAAFNRIFQTMLKISDYKINETYKKFDKLFGVQLFIIYSFALKVKNTTQYIEYINGNFSKDDLKNLFPTDSRMLRLLKQHSNLLDSEALYEYLFEIYTDLFCAYTDMSNFKHFTYGEVCEIKSLIKYEI